jgi:hypothetical protein
MILQQGGGLLAASEQVINRILADMRAALDAKKIVFEDRMKNLDALAKLGLTKEDAYDEIYELSPDNYISGPSIDRDFPTEDKFWVFKKIVIGHLMYIKFKIVYLEDGRIKIVSFHMNDDF